MWLTEGWAETKARCSSRVIAFRRKLMRSAPCSTHKPTEAYGISRSFVHTVSSYMKQKQAAQQDHGSCLSRVSPTPDLVLRGCLTW